MHLLLTDRLTCPRCGPEFGLILLADKLVDRVVHSGVLGCPNCRDAFQVEDGFADLRAPPRRGLEAGRGKWPGRLVKGSGLEARRWKLSGDCSWNGLEACRASWSESSSKEVIWWLVEGNGLGIPKKQKRDPPTKK